MKYTYDAKTDGLYISLRSGKYDKTKKITDSLLVDVSRDGKVLAIEILEASKNIEKFNPKSIPTL